MNCSITIASSLFKVRNIQEGIPLIPPSFSSCIEVETTREFKTALSAEFSDMLMATSGQVKEKHSIFPQSKTLTKDLINGLKINLSKLIVTLQECVRGVKQIRERSKEPTVLEWQSLTAHH